MLSALSGRAHAFSVAILDGSAAYAVSHWSANVDYAVYAPGTYPGDHPDKASNYIYTYQIFNAAEPITPIRSVRT